MYQKLILGSQEQMLYISSENLGEHVLQLDVVTLRIVTSLLRQVIISNFFSVCFIFGNSEMMFVAIL